MKHTLVTLAASLSIATIASSAYAHHSHPYFYDACNSITIEGRIERVEFKDPHTQIVLKLDEGTAYVVDWAGLRGLTNNGTIASAKEALVFGARVTVTGSRIRTAAQIRERFPEIKSDWIANPNTVDPISIRRVGDGFNWALTNAPSCDRK